MKRLIAYFTIVICLSLIVKADTPVNLRRICKNGTANILYFTPTSDTCSGYFQYKIWGRNGPFGAFALIDSISLKTQEEYIHLDANPIGNPTKWAYYIETIDSCGPDYSTSSAVVPVDETPPNTTLIKLVTVDPLTNKVKIEWQSNTSPDFSYYILYKDSNSVYVPVYTGKDTITLDNNPFTDPSQKAITYDISPVDSCGNAKVFGVNPHTTIHLQYAVDTCKKTIDLNWSPYIGWTSVSAYYIYKRIENGTLILLDSIFPPQLSYSDTITLGLSYLYYITGIQGGNVAVQSSSNGISFTTRFRLEPESSYLALVSVDKPHDETLSIKIYNPNEESKRYEVFSGLFLSETNISVGDLLNPSSLGGILGLQIPFVSYQKYYGAMAYNTCNEAFNIKNKSRYISLQVVSQGDKNVVSWDPYFTWNSGVNYYRIYRGTSDESGTTTFNIIDSVSQNDSLYLDENLPERVGEVGLCYYVEAIQQPGDVNGEPLSSFSTTACAIGAPTVYIPNAFRPDGFNKTFRPEGSYIDYDRSKLEIFDRWGARLIEINGIRGGWNGRDANGINCMQGVYYYKTTIFSTNGTEKTFTGFVTLLN